MPASWFPDGGLAARYLAAQAIAREAGLLGARYLSDLDSLDVREKGPQDFVSAADRALEALIATRINQAFPDDAFLGEESADKTFDFANAEMLWVVDPIDGTANFIRGGDEWCVSIGLLNRGQPVAGVIYQPSRNRLYAARQGCGASRDGLPLKVSQRASLASATVAIDHSTRASAHDHLQMIELILGCSADYRRNGCCTFSLVEVAEGRLDGFVELNLNAWDVAAGVVLVNEAGGWTNDFFGGSGLPMGKPLIAAAPGLKDDLLAALGFEERNGILSRLSR